jgi:hypothetical protein
MIAAKKFYNDNIDKIPKNTNIYIFDVLSDKNYPDNTKITIYSDGGLDIHRYHTVVKKYYDINLPLDKKIICPVCERKIANGSYYSHVLSRFHRSHM